MHRVPASGVHGNPSVHVVLDVCALQEDCGWLRDLAIPASVRVLPAASSCARQPFRYFMCSAPVNLSSISLELPNKRLSWHPLEIDSSSLGDVWEFFFFFYWFHFFPGMFYWWTIGGEFCQPSLSGTLANNYGKLSSLRHPNRTFFRSRSKLPNPLIDSIATSTASMFWPSVHDQKHLRARFLRKLHKWFK